MDDLNLVYSISRLLKRLRSRMRFGALSRVPLEILRVELIVSTRCLNCDWVIRPIDKWDAHQPSAARARMQTEQALHDALAMPEMLFRLFPEARTTELCAYRVASDGHHELVLAGTVQRGEEVPGSLASVTMRAHLAGFRFVLADGVLCALPLNRVRYAGDTYVA